MPPSPTINTKNALAEVLEMFNQPLRHERDRAEPVHSKEDTKVAEWAAELVKQPKCTKLQVYCDETDEAEPTPSNPFNAEEEKREEAASTNTSSHIVQSEPASLQSTATMLMRRNQR
ncbi:hypothetical protein BDF22DRAFT_145904 [Syncephalis plumigaleata]|nr:hypothetical protein BDF22DRAFT_145904 [Syncephalis plumigaleata]